MNYDGPSFYKRKQGKVEASNQNVNQLKKNTPLDTIKDEEDRINYLSQENIKQRKKIEERAGNYAFRGTQIPDSLQKLAGWDKNKENRELLLKVEKRLKKKSTDYLLFAGKMIEDQTSEQVQGVQKTKSDLPNTRSTEIQRKIAEIENTLDTVAMVQEDLKTDRTKPTIATHRVLSQISPKKDTN